VTSSITVAGSAADQMWGQFPSPQGGGTTQYLLLTAIPSGLQTGDFLEYYEEDYATPSEVYSIEEIDFEANVIMIDGEVPSDRVIEISQNKTPPFGLLRVKQVLSTNGLETKLNTWRNRVQNLPAFFTELARFINPLIANDNPTAVQVTDAINKVREMYKYLTITAATEYGGTTTDTLESILDAYTVEHQPPVDTLIKSFKEKGADRAVDILLEGSFTGFFGLDADSSSYAGDMMAKMRELAREDLPIRRTDRQEAQSQQLLASTEDEDFENSDSDTDVPRPPTG
jgi:predicted lactoylglutathione lyase